MTSRAKKLLKLVANHNDKKPIFEFPSHQTEFSGPKSTFENIHNYYSTTSNLPLYTYNNSGNKVPPLSNLSVENVSNLELYENLEPEFQILLENNFEGIEIEYYNIDNNINKSDDSNQNMDIEVELEHQKKKTKWSRSVRKERKLNLHKGLPFVSSSGKSIAGKQIQPLKKCRKMCHTFLTDNFDSNKNRTLTLNYFFEINGQRHSVCKDCFLKTLDERRSVTKNKGLNISGIVNLDKRGKKSPKNKISDDRLIKVIEHINSFPSYESHYTRLG
ncbi:hypothetical protein AGLY_012338 [Aphis glycines]|uniref:Uncharacterized protein n=1 Tax=Aphis glycines TaxID=307491 RepID=A0A6G0T9T6_APHGL|nr:hypothetical protein AGLY_012338 [Aphis glycines]